MTAAREGVQSGLDSSGRYVVSAADKQFFLDNGYLLLEGVLSEEEMQQHIDPVYQAYMRREIDVPGKDLCDMSGASGRAPSDFTVYNVMLPRKYHPSWQGNLYEQRATDIANQLRGPDMVLDFDQIFAKAPQSGDSAFKWHQDCAYWPPLKSDTSAVNSWLAVTDVTLDNGCLRYIPGSHREGKVRAHHPVNASREASHAIYTKVDEGRENIVDVPAKRGSVILHHEAAVHASRPNLSAEWRHAYILNFRKAECVAEERSLGFTHSHNDPVNWDVFARWAEV